MKLKGPDGGIFEVSISEHGESIQLLSCVPTGIKDLEDAKKLKTPNLRDCEIIKISEKERALLKKYNYNLKGL